MTSRKKDFIVSIILIALGIVAAFINFILVSMPGIIVSIVFMIGFWGIIILNPDNFNDHFVSIWVGILTLSFFFNVGFSVIAIVEFIK